MTRVPPPQPTRGWREEPPRRPLASEQVQQEQEEQQEQVQQEQEEQQEQQEQEEQEQEEEQQEWSMLKWLTLLTCLTYLMWLGTALLLNPLPRLLLLVLRHRTCNRHRRLCRR